MTGGWTPARIARWAALALLLAIVVFACGRSTERIPLTQLYTPSFGAAPPPEPARVSLQKTIDWLTSRDGLAAVQRLLPDQGGVLWLALLVAVAVGFDFRNPRNPRNIDLLLMQLIGWCFFNVLSFAYHLQNPTERNLMDWVFSTVFFLTLALLVRAVVRARRPFRVAWRPTVGREALVAIALTLVAANVCAALAYDPDDAGYFVNIGAQRLRERGRLPYGDPLLTGTPAAAYGPVLYAAHVPFQLMLSPTPVNPVSPPRPLIESGQPYYLPPILATKLCTIAFHVLGLIALFAAARRLAGSSVAWALVALYCGSAFVLGVGGDRVFVGGMTFVSHIAPAAATLVAFALLERPAWSGAWLAIAVGVLFYPVFMIPAWLGYYWGRKQELRAFVVGCAIAAAIIGGTVLALSHPAGGRGRIATIVDDTLGHQESPQAYGSSPFGFWGQREGVRKWLMTPIADGVSISRPVVLAFFVFAAAMFFVAQGRTAAQFALIVAAIAMGAQLWKIHGTATYVAWYYPFLLIGLFCQPAADDAVAC